MGLTNNMRLIHNLTCMVLGVDYSSTFKKSRKPEFIKARYITMVISKKIHINENLENIGSFFGQGHAIVLYAIKMVSNRCETEKEYKNNFDFIFKRCKNIKIIKHHNDDKNNNLTQDEFIKELKKLIYSTKNINLSVNVNELINKL